MSSILTRPSTRREQATESSGEKIFIKDQCDKRSRGLKHPNMFDSWRLRTSNFHVVCFREMFWFLPRWSIWSLQNPSESDTGCSGSNEVLQSKKRREVSKNANYYNILYFRYTRSKSVWVDFTPAGSCSTVSAFVLQNSSASYPACDFITAKSDYV